MLSIDTIHKIQVLYLCSIALDFCALLPYNRDSEKGFAYKRAREKEEMDVSIKYKIDVLAALKEVGYSSTRIRKEKVMGQATLTQIRHGELVSWANINRICALLDCQPGDLLEYVKDEMEQESQ